MPIRGTRRIPRARAGPALTCRFGVAAGIVGIVAVVVGVFGGVVAPGTASAAATVTLSPPVIHPGGTVEVRADCAEKSGQAAVGRPSEQALASTVLQPQPTGTGVWGTLVVPANTAPGSYTVAVLCGTAGQQGTASLTVAPSGGANTGGGATSAGPNSLLIVAGATLVGVAALGGGYLLVRRRQRDA